MLKPFADARTIYQVIEPALRAPSVGNAQPWSFRIVADDRVELRAGPGDADGGAAGPGRWELLLYSPAPGPWAREYTISCGAALLNMRLAIRALGYDPVVTLVPFPAADPGLLASVEVAAGRTHRPVALDQELYGAIRQRHTDRWPFSGVAVRPGILVEMERAAAREQGWLRVLHGSFARTWLKVAAGADAVIAAAGDGARDAGRPLPGGEEAAARALSYDTLLGQFRAELARWTDDSAAGRGIPGPLLGPHPARRRAPARDFRLGEAGHEQVYGKQAGPGAGLSDAAGASEAGAGEAGGTRPGGARRARFERHPQLMMLFTDRDEPIDWLRAGQALQRALLTAASLSVSASFLTQPLELADLAFQYAPVDGQASRLLGSAHRRLPSLRRAADASERTSSSPVERRGYVRRRLLGATPWLEVPQMVIRVGYPAGAAGKPVLGTPRAEPEIIDARAEPARRLARPAAGGTGDPAGTLPSPG